MLASPTTPKNSVYSGISAPSPICGFPIITIGSFAGTGAGQFIQDQLVFQNTSHFLDSVSYNHGDHLMKFGAEFHHTLYRGYGAPTMSMAPFISTAARFSGRKWLLGAGRFPGRDAIQWTVAAEPGANHRGLQSLRRLLSGRLADLEND